MTILNNVGPSLTRPCGTPRLTFSHEENVSPILTLCCKHESIAHEAEGRMRY